MSYSPMAFNTATAGRAGFVRLGSGIGGQSDGTIVSNSTLLGLTKSSVGLGNVENTALSTWAGSSAITTLGTVTSGSAPASDVYAWAKASTKPSYTKSEVGLGNVDNTADTNKSVNYAATAGRAYPYRSDGNNLNFYWSGQSGQPTWLWGGNDGTNMYVYNPSNFNVNYATSAGSASTAGSAGSASTAGSVSGGLVWRLESSNSFTLGYNSWYNTLCTHSAGIYLLYITWDDSSANPSYFRGTCMYGGNDGMFNSQSGSTQATMNGSGSYGEQCYVNSNGSTQHNNYFYVYWFGSKGFNNSAPNVTANFYAYKLQS